MTEKWKEAYKEGRGRILLGIFQNIAGSSVRCHDFITRRPRIQRKLIVQHNNEIMAWCSCLQGSHLSTCFLSACFRAPRQHHLFQPYRVSAQKRDSLNLFISNVDLVVWHSGKVSLSEYTGILTSFKWAFILPEWIICAWSHEPLSSGTPGRRCSLISSVDSQSCVLGALSAWVSRRLGSLTTPPMPSHYICRRIFFSFLMIPGILGQSAFHCLNHDPQTTRMLPPIWAIWCKGKTLHLS